MKLQTSDGEYLPPFPVYFFSTFESLTIQVPSAVPVALCCIDSIDQPEIPFQVIEVHLHRRWRT
jgi:hypothetical protein